jgi:hypothetical protein
LLRRHCPPGLEAAGEIPIFGLEALDVRAFRVIREAIWLAADPHLI